MLFPLLRSVHHTGRHLLQAKRCHCSRMASLQGLLPRLASRLFLCRCLEDELQVDDRHADVHGRR